MEKLPISRENARAIIKQSLRRGPVHMFADEADDAAKESVRSLLAHWPNVFNDDDSEEQKHAR